MARARNIKPSFFDNDELAELSPLTRLLFIGMWTIADHNGNFEWREKRIKKQLLAYDSCSIKELAINLDKSGFIRFYSDGNKIYVNIVNFAKHQNPHKNEREKETEIPVIIKEARQVIDLTTLTINHDLSGEIPEDYGTHRADSLNLIPDSCTPKSGVEPTPPTPYPKIWELYKSILNSDNEFKLVQVMSMTDERKKAMKKLWRLVDYDFDRISRYFQWIYDARQNHTWLFGYNARNWVADIEYICREKTYVKAQEGQLGDWSDAA